jgi:uncharacterized protein
METKQFLYKLQLIPKLLDENNWTDKENTIVSTHFSYLQNLLKENKVIMAGRTLNYDPFGIVILEVESLEEADQIMKNDPAVKEGIMTAELFPFRVALVNQ